MDLRMAPMRGFVGWCLEDSLGQLTKRRKIDWSRAGGRGPKEIGEIKAMIPKYGTRMWSGRSRFEMGTVLGWVWARARFVGCGGDGSNGPRLMRIVEVI